MTVFEKFQNPSREYTTVPFWFWNDRMDCDEITRQLELMYEQHVYECVVHARYGLETPYFSEEWFDCIQCTIRTAKRLGMRIWIYDENNWPSGYAGGRVLAENPDYCGKNLGVFQCEPGENPPEDILYTVAVFVKECDGTWKRISETKTDVKRYVFAVRYTCWKVAYGQDYYVDLLNYDATAAFMRITHEEYKRRFGDEFGDVIRGFFSDEAGFYNGLQLPWSDRSDDGTLVWTDRLPEGFEKINGYDINDYLPYLFFEVQGISAKIRRNFHETAAALYCRSFLTPQRNFCEQNGMKLIGHLHYEEYMHLHTATQGNFIKALSEFSYAGCDRIEYCPGAITERLTASVGRVYGKPRVLSETFAQGGWDFTMQDMRRWTDFQLVRGINLFVVHAFFYSVRDYRKNDAPPSFFFQSPAYPFYHLYSDYTMRLCQLLSSGTPVNGLAVLFPTASSQIVFDVIDREAVRSLDRDVQEIVKALEEAQYDCCLINEEAIVGANVKHGTFCAGNESFSSLAVPAKWLPFQVLTAICRLSDGGIPVAFLRHLPKCIEPEHSEEFEQLLATLLVKKSVGFIDEYHFYRKFTYRFQPKCFSSIKGFSEAALPVAELQSPDSDIKICARKIDQTRVYFIVNESGADINNTVYFNEETVPSVWDAMTGEKKYCPFTLTSGQTAVPLKLPPYGSVIIAFGDSAIEKPRETKLIRRECLDGCWKITVAGKTFDSILKCFDNKTDGKIDSIKYEYEIELETPGDFSVLSFERIHNICEISINGQNAGAILWKPNSITTNLLKSGKNHICVTVYATPAGVLEETSLPFGIDGNVYLDIKKTMED